MGQAYKRNALEDGGAALVGAVAPGRAKAQVVAEGEGRMAQGKADACAARPGT